MKKFTFYIIFLFTLPVMITAQYTRGNGEGGASTFNMNSPHQSRLVSFTSDISGRNIRLDWVTASEQNITGFEVERTVVSNHKSEYSKVGFIEGNGALNSQSNHSFEDKNLQTGKYEYRLKQIYNNGFYEYHKLNGSIEVSLPARFELNQIAQNPLNPITKIEFTLPKDSKVSIKIFDVDNKEVLTLINEVRTAGFHSIQFFVPHILNGSYFYSFMAETGGKKTVLLSRCFDNKNIIQE